MENLRIEVYFIYLLVASFSNIWILDGRIHSSLSTETWDSVYSVILSLENREKSTISFHISSFTNVGKTCPVSLLSIMVGPPLLSGWLEDKGGNTQCDPRVAGRSLQMRMWDRLGGTREILPAVCGHVSDGAHLSFQDVRQLSPVWAGDMAGCCDIPGVELSSPAGDIQYSNERPTISHHGASSPSSIVISDLSRRNSLQSNEEKQTKIKLEKEDDLRIILFGVIDWSKSWLFLFSTQFKTNNGAVESI